MTIITQVFRYMYSIFLLMSGALVSKKGLGLTSTPLTLKDFHLRVLTSPPRNRILNVKGKIVLNLLQFPK